MFSGYTRIISEINKRRNSGKSPSIYLDIKNSWDKEAIKGEIRMYFTWNKNENTAY